jgi:hypothetical protein
MGNPRPMTRPNYEEVTVGTPNSHERERALAVLLARADDQWDHEPVRELLAKPLDWNWIVVTACRHKIAQLLWHNLTRRDLIAPGLGTGGLPELWMVYLSQLFTASRERNRLWMANTAAVSARFREAGLPVAAIKGGALIGDVYTEENRFLNDIDFIARRSDLGGIKEVLFGLGYTYGSYNYATGRIDPISTRVERAWLFNNHTMPNFYKLTGHDTVPYYKIQVGYDFFDPFEAYSLDGAQVVAKATGKSDGSGILVPSAADTFVNLCAHIYREGVSLVYEDYNVNWQLGKFCDLLAFLLKHDAELDLPTVAAFVDGQGIRKPFYYGLHHADQVYHHPVFGRWLAAMDPGDHDYLGELTDGGRRGRAEGPFLDRLFSLRAVRADFQAGWNKQFTKDQW